MIVEELTIEETTAEDSQLIDELSVDSVGRWNRLVSRTNWEKGEVIHRWRTQLRDAGLPNSAYSDESWSRRVGNVSPQHVGRLRRVFERFGPAGEQYPSLYWSHFQAALDWDDAEMWLEGANLSQWSVAIMRIKRWETLGAPADMKPKDRDIILSELDEDVSPFNDSQAVLEGNESRIEPAEKNRKSSSEGDWDDVPFDLDEKPGKKGKKSAETDDSEILTTGEALTKLHTVKELPSDLSEAFEQLKVAILNHKLSGWKEVDKQQVLTCLTAMRTVVLAKEDD
ncbi:MAG: hypothetical protein FWC43_08325 [Planctomycetaceae bacterium]|nr:hypothetical protein [Planctomycetaceae bacterium]